MLYKRGVQLAVILAILIISLGFAGTASAWYCNSYVTVQWGDTLSGIAALCGTTVAAIQAANPGLGWWIYAGQVLYLPNSSSPSYYPPPTSGYYSGSYGGTYVVQWGDTLASIAARYGVGVNDMLAANPNIYSASWIYAGQVLNIPAAPAYYTVQSGDTMRIIAARYGTSVYSLQLLNPQIYNINWIYPGQSIRVR